MVEKKDILAEDIKSDRLSFTHSNIRAKFLFASAFLENTLKQAFL
jgi:hypothetical protein